ncbi:MAG: hypothetical protein COC09_06480 [Gammaproteobacteria bacterium]|nr:MAG: hypothetical protein COC09_06480 [Gammaproteobacteria bacterium]
MTEFYECTVIDVTDNFDKKRIPLSAKQRGDIAKIFPYYGAQSIIDYVDDYLFDGEYILVAEDGENLNSQNSNVCNLVNGKFWVNNHAHIIRAKEGYNTKYLYYYLNLINFKPFVTGSAQPKLTKDNLNSIPLTIHCENYQNKIAKMLDDLDKKIALNNKINAELEAMAKLIYDYWFVQFDFPDANGKPYKSSGGKMIYNEALKREIPDGWGDFKLSTILKSNYSSIGKDDCFDEIQYLDTGSLTKNIIEGTERIKPAQDKIPSRARRIIKKNDILYSTVRPNLCHYGIVKNPLDNMIGSTGFVQLSSKISSISNDLVYIFLTSSWVTERLHQIAALAVSAYPSISPNDILDLNIALPESLGGMGSINSKFDTIYSKISLNQKENQKLSELRDWLLPMLMNGQVTVNDS